MSLRVLKNSGSIFRAAFANVRKETEKNFTNNKIPRQQKLGTVSEVDSAHTSSKDGARFA